MELKDFIKATVSGIVGAADELQEQFSDRGLIVWPPEIQTNEDVASAIRQQTSTNRRMNIRFEVIVTSSSEKNVNGEGKLNVSFVQAGMGGEYNSGHQHSNKLSFTIPIALSPPEEKPQR